MRGSTSSSVMMALMAVTVSGCGWLGFTDSVELASESPAPDMVPLGGLGEAGTPPAEPLPMPTGLMATAPAVGTMVWPEPAVQPVGFAAEPDPSANTPDGFHVPPGETPPASPIWRIAQAAEDAPSPGGDVARGDAAAPSAATTPAAAPTEGLTAPGSMLPPSAPPSVEPAAETPPWSTLPFPALPRSNVPPALLDEEDESPPPVVPGGPPQPRAADPVGPPSGPPSLLIEEPATNPADLTAPVMPSVMEPDRFPGPVASPLIDPRRPPWSDASPDRTLWPSELESRPNAAWPTEPAPRSMPADVPGTDASTTDASTTDAPATGARLGEAGPVSTPDVSTADVSTPNADEPARGPTMEPPLRTPVVLPDEPSDGPTGVAEPMTESTTEPVTEPPTDAAPSRGPPPLFREVDPTEPPAANSEPEPMRPPGLEPSGLEPPSAEPPGSERRRSDAFGAEGLPSWLTEPPTGDVDPPATPSRAWNGEGLSLPPGLTPQTADADDDAAAPGASEGSPPRSEPPAEGGRPWPDTPTRDAPARDTPALGTPPGETPTRGGPAGGLPWSPPTAMPSLEVESPDRSDAAPSPPAETPAEDSTPAAPPSPNPPTTNLPPTTPPSTVPPADERSDSRPSEPVEPMSSPQATPSVEADAPVPESGERPTPAAVPRPDGRARPAIDPDVTPPTPLVPARTEDLPRFDPATSLAPTLPRYEPPPPARLPEPESPTRPDPRPLPAADLPSDPMPEPTEDRMAPAEGSIGASPSPDAAVPPPRDRRPSDTPQAEPSRASTSRAEVPAPEARPSRSVPTEAGAPLPADGAAPQRFSGVRIWTDTTESYREEASIVAHDATWVRLRTPSGERLRISRSKLSQRDQGYLAALDGQNGYSEPVWRAWTDRSGLYRVTAKFLGFDGDEVRLEKSAGRVVRIRADRLSEFDQGYLDAMRRMAENL